ncbi:MAG TPA: hypothetical protein VKB76_14965, partial [Ktedonobacterales bacterium]|nr:hypothetical protein [Ktedonobacterales bacterium]
FLRMQALLALDDGDRDGAYVALNKALRIAEEIGLPGEQWQMHALLGAISRQWKAGEAETHIRAAISIAQDLAGNIQHKPLRDRFRAAALNAVQP